MANQDSVAHVYRRSRGPAFTRLRAELNRGPRDSASELVLKAKDFDALLISSMFSAGRCYMRCRLHTLIATFSLAPTILTPAAAARSIAFSNTPDVLTDATADICPLLCLVPRGCELGDRMVRRIDCRHLRCCSLGLTADAGSAFLAWGAWQAVPRRKPSTWNCTTTTERGWTQALSMAPVSYRFESMLPHCDFLSIIAPQR